MACGSSIFLSRPRAVLVDTDDRAVGDELLQVRLPTKPLNNLFQNLFFRQAVKPHVHRVPLAELPGLVARGSTRVLNPQHGLHKQAVVPAVTPGSPCLPGSRPLMGSHWSSRKSSLKMASSLKSR